ncbi:MAG: hypothetical protein ACPLPP_04925 [Caldisericum exile]
MQEEKGDTYITSKIINLERKFKLLERILNDEVSFSDLLLVRGFKYFSYFEPSKIDGSKLFNLLSKYYVRRFLADFFMFENVRKEDLNQLMTKWKIKNSTVQDLLDSRIVLMENEKFFRNPDIRDFSFIVESLIAFLLNKKFGIDSILNVKLKELSKGGDIDILGKWKLELIMIELKESPPNNVSLTELKLTFERFRSVSPDIFIFALDTTLSIKRNIIDNLTNLYKVNPQKIREGIYKISENSFVVTAKRDLLSNISYVLYEKIL